MKKIIIFGCGGHAKIVLECIKLEKSKSLLFNSSSKLKAEIAALNKTIYHVKERGKIKNKIILDCMRIIQNS
jgi:hypothetical protein